MESKWSLINTNSINKNNYIQIKKSIKSDKKISSKKNQKEKEQNKKLIALKASSMVYKTNSKLHHISIISQLPFYKVISNNPNNFNLFS